MKENDKFLKLIPKLSQIEFIGLARILRVPLVQEINPGAAESQERYKTRDFTEVLADVIRYFEEAPRSRRREILQLLSAAVRRGSDNADNS